MFERVSDSFCATCGLAVLVFAAACGSNRETNEPDAGAGFLRVANAAEEPASAPAEQRVDALAEKKVAVEEPAREAPAEPRVAKQEPPKPAEAAAPAPKTNDREAEAQRLLDAQDFARAARAYSARLLELVSSGEDDRAAIERCAAGLGRAQAGHRWSARGSWPSIDVRVQPGDSLIAIRKRVLAQHSDWLLCTGLIARANQLKSETAIRPDNVLRIPTDRPSVMVDISARWAFFLLGDEVAAAWSVGVGKDGADTRPGDYTIGLKQENPMWAPVGRDPVPYGDPANPLGTRWLAWYQAGKNSTLGFHGTNDAATVGQRVSDGCVRMRNSDVEELFEILPLGASVRVMP